KSHAAAYALLSYQTAWLKTHYPEEFYAASMCFDMHQSEKLAVYVDDLRRNGVALLGPDIGASEAEFCVEQTDEGWAVRYALAGIRNVGEKAMNEVVAEREAHGPFEGLEDLFRRLPPGSMNRKQLEGLAGAGAFDRFEPNRARVLASADMLLAVADAANREKASGQGGLFGGEDHAEPSLRLADVEPWSRADQMAMERDVFGFYFAAHPVAEFREVASANGARSYASLMESGGGGGRQPAVMAAMVESVSKGRTKRGAEFVRADFSDNTGQFSAACFEESLVDSFQQWAADGTCVLLNVELDSPNPEDPPRVTVRGARPLAEVKSSAKMQLTADVDDAAAITALVDLLVPGTPGNGEVVLHLRLGEDYEPRVLLGSDFALGGELVDRLAGIPGLRNVALAPIRGVGHLRLVA
ncbi:MAG: DNA polymerase III subunit alpha, partial [Erythrobacter sp.]|nr:DNA polymerase III subunit alpha [Erythrobacter sp.]